MTSARPALFLDRDGVLNVDRGFVARVEDFEWIEGAIDCVRAFNQRNWHIFIVTNQSGIALGSYTEDDMNAVHSHMLSEFDKQSVHVDRIYSCPFHPEATIPEFRKDSPDRKPAPGMLLKAMADFPVKREMSFLIGDKPTDIEAAEAAGIPGFLFSGGNLHEFAEWSLATVQDGAR